MIGDSVVYTNAPGNNSSHVCQTDPARRTNPGMCKESAKADMVREVARMIAQWESSPELPSELAERLVDYFAARAADTSDAKTCA